MDYVDFNDVLSNNHSFIITAHVNPDGDAIGAANALGLVLLKMGKQATVIYSEKIPERYSFLSQPDFKTFDYQQEHADVLISLDASDMDRISPIKDYIRYRVLVNIDHHLTNTNFGDLNIVNADKSATCELLYDLFQEIELTYDSYVAENLYTGMLTDTGSFNYENTTYKTLEIASILVKMGVKPWKITKEIFEKVPIDTFYFTHQVLSQVKMTSDLKIGWLSIDRSMLSEFQVDETELEGLINQIKKIETLEIALLFKETKEGFTKVGFRSNIIDVSKIAFEYQGGGHPRAAGCLLHLPISKAKEEIITRLEQLL